MESQKSGFQTIDAYFASFPPDDRKLLETLRATIHAAAPDAVEKMSYQMPAFGRHGILVYFAGTKHHIGFYPTFGAITAFQAELAPYECSRGTVRFPKDRPLPLDLITRMVEFRVAEDDERAAAKARKRKS